MLKCKKCFKKFSSKQRLEYHITNKVCFKYEKKFCCLFCDRRYKTKYTFLQHLNQKHKKKFCKNLTKYDKIPSQIPSQNCSNLTKYDDFPSQMAKIPSQMAKIPSQIPSQIILLNCEYCNNKFSRRDNLKRHKKLYCKKKKNHLIKK